MAQNKPLPTLPIILPDPATLSVEARHHRAALIDHFLNDLHDASIENQRDRWLHVFEEVLDDLGRSIDSEEWLTRTRKGKELKRSLTKHTTRDPNTQKGEVNAKVAGGTTRGTTSPKELPEIPRSSSLQPFQQLFTLASRPVPPVGPGHLLLCLAPHGSLPTKGDSFDIVPANIGCTFSSGNFMLKDSSQADGTILFGLDDFESEQLSARI